MLGQQCFLPGEAKATFGTGCFMLLNTGVTPVQSEHGLLTTVCFQLGAGAETIYALEGSVAVAGSGVRWLRDGLGLIKETQEVNALATSVPSSNDVYFVPAFSGLLSPYWRDDARGVIAGLTHSSNAGHLARAVLEAAAYQTREVLDAMAADTAGAVTLKTLRVDGGMSASDTLMQFQADILDLPVVRPASLEATASGAAFCAGLAVGFWSSRADLTDSVSATCGQTTFVSQMTPEARDALFRGWKKAVQRTFGWVEAPPNSRILPPPTVPVFSGAATPTAAASARALPAAKLPTPAAGSSGRPSLPVVASVCAKRSPLLTHLATLGFGLLLGAGFMTMRQSGQSKRS